MVLNMIAEIDGGREVVAAHLGMTPDALNNRIYEKKGQHISFDDLLRIQELSGTNHLAQYCLPEGEVIVREPTADECDLVELSKIMLATQGSYGELQAFLNLALSDDQLTPEEDLELKQYKKAFISNLEKQHKAVRIIFGTK